MLLLTQVARLLRFFTCQKAIPETTFSLHVHLENRSACLQVVDNFVTDTERTLDFNQGSKLAFIVLKIEVSIVSLANERVHAADTDVLHSQVIVGAPPNPHIILHFGCVS